MADPQHIRTLFFKFLSDACTPEETEEIIHYLKTSNSDEGLPGVEEVRARLGFLPRLDERRADQMFHAIIEADNNLRPGIDPARPATYWWRLAAAVTGILLLAGILFFRHQQAPDYVTAFGETKAIQLPDGSRITLNANSELRLAEDWSEGLAREVWLEGEAFFSVVHTHDDRKFLVHTSQELSVEVLGTEFNVNSRNDKATVVLNSGKVNVQAQQEGAHARWTMQPGDLLAYESSTQQVKQQSVDTALYTSWKDNLLLFKDTPLAAIASVISENYGYQVSFGNDSLARLRFTGSNPADQLDLLLETLELSFNLQIVKEKKRIYIKRME